MKKTSATKRKTTVISRPKTTNNGNQNTGTSNTTRLVAGKPQRKASTPTHNKPAGPESPDVSRIIPTETSSSSNDGPVARKHPVPILAPTTKAVPSADEELSLTDQIDFEYTRYLQTMFRRKLAEAEASEVDNRLMELQKRIAENQNILQKTTERLKNINFNKEVETLHKLKNPNYGRVLETLDNVNCKEYLETVNRKLEQRQNQLKLKNIELPEGGSAELLKIVKDTVAACEHLRANNALEVPKVIAEIKASNNSTSETLSRCLEMVPEVENLILDKATLDMSAKDLGFDDKCNND